MTREQLTCLAANFNAASYIRARDGMGPESAYKMALIMLTDAIMTNDITVLFRKNPKKPAHIEASIIGLANGYEKSRP